MNSQVSDELTSDATRCDRVAVTHREPNRLTLVGPLSWVHLPALALMHQRRSASAADRRARVASGHGSTTRQ